MCVHCVSIPEPNNSSESIKMAPQLQKKAPGFKGTAVIDGQFKEISLDDYKGKYLVVFFYPLDL